ncbi:MAG: MBL fold metallo-hydrolase, partial [Clostridium sp.]|nr:MBL fold metallo-hydrolase [Clostridium sp.]
MPTITTLIENTPSPSIPTLQAEHGLSLYIEHPEANILFDTGQTGDFLANAQILGKNLADVNHVIISHGHYDHGNGLPRLLSANILSKTADLIVGQEFFHLKYKKLEDETYSYNGVSLTEQDILSTGIQLRKITEDTIYLTDHIILFHHFTQSNNFEHLNKKFISRPPESPVKKILSKESVEATCQYTDAFLDELALGIVTEQGLIVIVGCSHIGIINILTDIQNRVNLPIY